MKVMESREEIYIECSKGRYKLVAENGGLTEIYLYKQGGYTNLEHLSSKELQILLIVVLSEFAKFDCSNYIQE